MAEIACRGLSCTSTKLIKAHIIPRGFARIAREDRNVIAIRPDRKPAVPKNQHGAFDPAILCERCDGKLGRYDDYAVTFCREFPEQAKPYSSLGFQVSDVDTDLLRKGVLAILWRGSISNQIECRSLSLGPYEPSVRDVLFGQRAFSELPHFQLIVQRYVAGKEKVGFYLFPYRTRFDGLNAYVMGLVGLRFIAKFDARPFPALLHDFIVSDESRVAGTNIDFDDASEGRTLRRMANPMFRLRTTGRL